jgi:hypothetical protein
VTSSPPKPISKIGPLRWLSSEAEYFAWKTGLSGETMADYLPPHVRLEKPPPWNERRVLFFVGGGRDGESLFIDSSQGDTIRVPIFEPIRPRGFRTDEYKIEKVYDNHKVYWIAFHSSIPRSDYGNMIHAAIKYILSQNG